jgi:hypothetical protein
MLRDIRSMLLVSAFLGALQGLLKTLVITFGFAIIGAKWFEDVVGFVFECLAIALSVLTFVSCSINFFRSTGDSAWRLGPGQSEHSFLLEDDPFFCSHGGALGRNGERCAKCAAEVAAMHETVRRYFYVRRQKYRPWKHSIGRSRLAWIWSIAPSWARWLAFKRWTLTILRGLRHASYQRLGGMLAQTNGRETAV